MNESAGRVPLGSLALRASGHSPPAPTQLSFGLVQGTASPSVNCKQMCFGCCGLARYKHRLTARAGDGGIERVCESAQKVAAGPRVVEDRCRGLRQGHVTNCCCLCWCRLRSYAALDIRGVGAFTVRKHPKASCLSAQPIQLFEAIR